MTKYILGPTEATAVLIWECSPMPGQPCLRWGKRAEDGQVEEPAESLKLDSRRKTADLKFAYRQRVELVKFTQFLRWTKDFA